MKPNRTWEFGIAANTEVFGFEAAKKAELDAAGNVVNEGTMGQAGKLGLSLGFKVMRNNYRGWGLGLDFGLNTNLIKEDKFGFNGGVNLGVNSFDGANLQPNFSFSKIKDEVTNTFYLSGTLNSLQGFTGLSLGYGRQKKKKSKTLILEIKCLLVAV